MTTGNKIMWKRGEIAPNIFLTSGVEVHIHLLNVVVQFIVFLTLSTLICRGTDISKCFSESLGIRDNESGLYFKPLSQTIKKLWSVQEFSIEIRSGEIKEQSKSCPSCMRHSYLTWYMSLPYIINLPQTVWELWLAQDFCFRGDK